MLQNRHHPSCHMPHCIPSYVMFGPRWLLLVKMMQLHLPHYPIHPQKAPICLKKTPWPLLLLSGLWLSLGGWYFSYWIWVCERFPHRKFPLLLFWARQAAKQATTNKPIWGISWASFAWEVLTRLVGFWRNTCLFKTLYFAKKIIRLYHFSYILSLLDASMLHHLEIYIVRVANLQWLKQGIKGSFWDNFFLSFNTKLKLKPKS